MTNLHQNSHLAKSAKSINQKTVEKKPKIKALKQHENGSSFNTLAQLRKIPKKNTPKEKEILMKRARAKFISQSFLSAMALLNSPLKYQYDNAWHCANKLTYDCEKFKLVGKYCKTKSCLVCNRIRTAILLKAYMPAFQKFNNPYLVTLTIPNVPDHALDIGIKCMNKTFRKLLDRYRKRNNLVDGIKKIEVTYNPIRKDYHPHFHIILDGENNASTLINDWLAMFPTANQLGQDMRPCDEQSLMEVFKYFTKVVTKNKNTKKDEYEIYLSALDVINQALHKKRIFQPFGNVKKDSEEIEEIQAIPFYENLDSNQFKWTHEVSDWVGVQHGELLTENNYHKSIKVKFK